MPLPARRRPSPRRVVALATVMAAVLAASGAVVPVHQGLAASPAPASPAPSQAPARLVVFVVVDQLRADLLTRYEALFDGGFRRLLDSGLHYTAMTLDHLTTETAPGHATLSTGTHPSRHGVVSNVWWEPADGGWAGVENVLDPDTRVAGDGALPGASPGVLLRTGVADWLLEAHPDARVVSVSAKPRGAVLLAGQGTGGGVRDVYWFEPAAGGFVTSTAYTDAPARWVTSFNQGRLQDFRADTVWESAVPSEAAQLSRPDTAAYELDGVRTHFPHTLAGAREATGTELGFWDWWTATPGPDRATLLLAAAAVEARELGADDAPDLLAVSLSQTDRIGHGYGPLSREQLDNLLRLDAALGDFFDGLDARLGPGAWTVALTSDHGAMDMPEWSAAHGHDHGVRLGASQLQGLEDLLGQVAREVGSLAPDKLAGPLSEAIVKLDWIARAWPQDALERAHPSKAGEPADSFTVLAVNGHHPGRVSGLLGRLGVTFQVAEGALPFGFEEGGSTHQSGYYHDRWIPLILMGQGIEAGTVNEGTSALSVAPTLAAFLGIATPDDLPAQPLIRPAP